MDLLRQVSEYADAHNGASMVWLTFVYVIASILMAVAMFRANSLSNKSLLRAEKMEIDRTRPHIVVDIEIHDLTFYYVVKNLGLTSARSVSIKVSPEPLGCLENLPTFLKSPIPTFAPGRTFESLLDSSYSFYQNNENQIFKVEVSYLDPAGNSYKEHSTIDLSVLKNSVPRPVKDKNLEDISKGIRELRRELSKIGLNLKSLSEQNLDKSD